MYMHPYVAMTLAADRADKLCAAASAHRLLRTTRKLRHADRISRGYHRSSTKPWQPGSRLSVPLAVGGEL